MARYLMDAVLTALRTSQAATAFGDTYSDTTGTGTQKFSADFAASPDLPYLIVEENPIDREYMTATAAGTAYLDSGMLHVAVMASARDTVRDLAAIVVRSLSDVECRWSSQFDSGRTLMFRLSGPPNPVAVYPSAEGSPVQFQIVLSFVYQSQGVM